MKVSLGAVRTRELSVSILLRDLVLSLSGSGRCRLPWRAGQNASTSLRTDHMGGLAVEIMLLRLLRQGLLLRHSRLGLVSRRHGAELNRGALGTSGARCRRRGDGLRMRRSRGGLRQHGGGGRVGLLGIVVHHGISSACTGAATGLLLGLRGRGVAGHSVGRARSIGCCWRSWCMRIAPVGGLLHGRVAGL